MITPKSLKESRKEFVKSRREIFENRKQKLVEASLLVLDKSVKAGTAQVSLYQISDVISEVGDSHLTLEKTDSSLFDENINEIKNELVKLGFKFNIEQPEYIVFEEQGE